MERALGRHDVFLSYSSKDKPTADAVCAILERNGVRVWMAPRDIFPGEEWAGSIIAAINDARVFVLLFSSFSNASPQIKREVERAANRGLPILPFRIDETPPNPTLEFFISTPHWLDAITPPLERHAERLANTVRRLIGPGDGADPVPPPPPPKAAPPPPAVDKQTVPPLPPSPPPKRVSPWLVVFCVALALLAIRFIPWRSTEPPDVKTPRGQAELKASEAVIASGLTPAPAPPSTTPFGDPTGEFVVYLEPAPGATETPLQTWAQAVEYSAASPDPDFISTPEAKPEGGYRVRVTKAMMTAVEAKGYCAGFHDTSDGRLTCRSSYERRTGSQAAAMLREK